LAEIGVAAGTGNTPKGFPDGVSWQDAYKMVTRQVEDRNPATPGTLVLDKDLLKGAVWPVPRRSETSAVPIYLASPEAPR